MEPTMTQFARTVVSGIRALDGFEAQLTLRAGELSMEAAVRCGPRRLIAVSYSAYVDPLADLEDRLSGSPEYVGEDLASLSLTFDGRHTWLHDPGSDVVVRKRGRVVYSPLRGVELIGELGFLRDFSHDFLLADRGSEEVHGVPARTIALRPKHRARSTLLKEEFYPVRDATVAFDTKTGFPLRVGFRPSNDAPLALLLPEGERVTVEHRNVVLAPPPSARFEFTPPEGSRVFAEDPIPWADLGARLPFAAPLDTLSTDGFVPVGNAVVAVDDDRRRGYLTAVLRRRSSDDSGSSQRITVRAGNYLSRNMSRRRAVLSEHGDPAPVPAERAWLLDRGEAFGRSIAAALAQPLVELGWEKDGTFWFLFCEGVEPEEILRRGRALLSAS